MMIPSEQEMFSFFREKLSIIKTDQVEENRVFAATDMYSYILDHFETFDEYAPTKLVVVIYKKCDEILSDASLNDYDELIVVCETLKRNLSNLLRTRIVRLWSYGELVKVV